MMVFLEVKISREGVAQVLGCEHEIVNLQRHAFQEFLSDMSYVMP